MGTGLGWERDRLVSQKTDDPLIALLSSLTRSLVKRWWAPLDAIKSVPTNLPSSLVFISTIKYWHSKTMPSIDSYWQNKLHVFLSWDYQIFWFSLLMWCLLKEFLTKNGFWCDKIEISKDYRFPRFKRICGTIHSKFDFWHAWMVIF